MSKNRALSVLACLIFFEGCAGSYGCKGFPNLPVCQSADQAYQATNGPSMGNETGPAKESQTMSKGNDDTANEAMKAGRADPSILRIWMAPFEDEDGDLQSTRYVFTDLEPGRWTLGSGGQQQTIRLTPLQVSQRQPISSGAFDQSHVPTTINRRAEAP